MHVWHSGQFLLEVRLFPWISKDLGYVHGVFNLGCHLWFYSFATSYHIKSLPQIRGYYPNSVGNSADKSLGNPHHMNGHILPPLVLAEHGCLLDLQGLSPQTGYSSMEDNDELKSHRFGSLDSFIVKIRGNWTFSQMN